MPEVRAPGNTVTYTLAYTNNGTDATDAVISDPLPAGITYVPGSAGSSATYDATTNTLSWSLGALAYHSAGQVTFQAMIDAAMAAGNSLYNQAEITAAELPVPVESNIAVFAVGASRADWWMFGHDAQHTGRSVFTGPSAPSLKWQSAAYVPDSCPVLSADGTIYVMSGGQVLNAVNPADGSSQWSTCFSGSRELQNYSNPAVAADGTIYVGSWGNFFALDPADGSLKWQYVIADPELQYILSGPLCFTSPVIGADGTIYVGSGFTNAWETNGNLYALNPVDGSLQWIAEQKAGLYSSPALGTDGTIFSAVNGNLYALNPKDGSLKWMKAVEYPYNPIYASPVIGADGTIYLGTAYPDNSRMPSTRRMARCAGNIPPAVLLSPPRPWERMGRSTSGQMTGTCMPSTGRWLAQMEL